MTKLFPEDQRDAILDKLHRGKITPEEAEAEAAAAKLRPFASEPAPNQFDPLKRARWSLPMALAWIATHDLEIVRSFDDEYRAECWDAHPRNLRFLSKDGDADNDEIWRGWHYVQRHAASWTTTLMELNAPQAVSALLESLESGALDADAVRVDDGALTPIPASEWSRLEICDDSGWRIYLRHTHAPASRIYSGVLLPRALVMKLWKSGPSGIAKHKAARLCKEWMESMMAASPNAPTKTKAECLDEAVQRFGVSRTCAETAYQESNRSPDRAAWRATGPKRNRPERQNVTRKGGSRNSSA